MAHCNTVPGYLQHLARGEEPCEHCSEAMLKRLMSNRLRSQRYHSGHTKQDIANEYGDACFYCGGEFEQIDHLHPVVRGGTNELSNLRPSCLRCNASKNDRLLYDWVFTKYRDIRFTKEALDLAVSLWYSRQDS